MKRSRPSYKSTQMPPDATGYTALLVLVLVLLSTMSAAVLRSLFAMSGDDQDQESPSLGAATSLMKITYMQMPDQVHRTLADASSVTLLPPFHPTLVAPPALAWSWGKALRVAGWARGTAQDGPRPEHGPQHGAHGRGSTIILDAGEKSLGQAPVSRGHVMYLRHAT